MCFGLQDDTREVDKMSGNTSQTGHRSKSRSESINSERNGHVLNHLMSDVSPSTTGIGIQVPASPTATNPESIQDEDGQKMDVVPADQGFQPLGPGSTLHDYVLQFSSYYNSQVSSGIIYVSSSLC